MMFFGFSLLKVWVVNKLSFVVWSDNFVLFNKLHQKIDMHLILIEYKILLTSSTKSLFNIAHKINPIKMLLFQPVTESRNNSMPSTSSLASSSSSSAINDGSSLTFPTIKPDRDDASSGYDSPDDCETTTSTFEKPHQHIVQQ